MVNPISTVEVTGEKGGQQEGKKGQRGFPGEGEWPVRTEAPQSDHGLLRQLQIFDTSERRQSEGSAKR